MRRILGIFVVVSSLLIVFVGCFRLINQGQKRIYPLFFHYGFKSEKSWDAGFKIISLDDRRTTVVNAPEFRMLQEVFLKSYSGEVIVSFLPKKEGQSPSAGLNDLQIHRIDVFTQTVKILTNGADPLTSPDEKHIVFRRVNILQQSETQMLHPSQVFLMNINGEKEVPLTNLDVNCQASMWTSDSKAVIADCEDISHSKSWVYKLPIDGSEPTVLMESGEFYIYNAKLSPSGQFLTYFQRSLKGSSRTQIRNLKNGTEQQLLVGNNPEGELEWAQNQDRLFIYQGNNKSPNPIFKLIIVDVGESQLIYTPLALESREAHWIDDQTIFSLKAQEYCLIKVSDPTHPDCS